MILTRTQTHALDAISLAEVYQHDPLTRSGNHVVQPLALLCPSGKITREKEITISLSMRPSPAHGHRVSTSAPHVRHMVHPPGEAVPLSSPLLKGQ